MLNPLMLFGLLGLALPVVIHLINRRRMPSRLLASVRFLDQEEIANTFAMVPRDVGQLLLRLLLLTAFVLLMVRLTRPAETPGPRAVTIVLDNSLSMQRKSPAGSSLFDAMRQQAGELIDDMRPSDKAGLVLVGDRVFSNTGLIRDREVLRRAVDEAWASAAGARALIPAIRQSLAELQGEPAPDRMVVVFSDWQQTTVDQAADDPELRRYLKEGRVRLVLVGKPLPKADNVTVEQAAFHPPALHIGSASKLTVKARNFSDKEKVVDVGLTVASSPGDTRTLTLGAGEAIHVDLDQRFDMWYDVGVAAKVEGGDPLSADDRYQVPMRMRESRNILLVASPAHQGAEGLERGYMGLDVLTYAINPEAALGMAAGVHTSIRRITPASFAQATLSSFQAVIFYGVDSLPEERSLTDLQDYVENGGGVWLIPDRHVMPVAFNRTFSTVMAGAEIGVLREPEAAVFTSRGESNLEHSLLRPLVRGQWTNPDEIPISSYRDVQQFGNARRALFTRAGDALAAVAEIGRGHVFLQLFDCDIRSTAFPRSTAFLPMIQTVLEYLTGGDDIPLPDVMEAGAIHDMHIPALRDVGGKVVVKGEATYRFPVDSEGWIHIHDIYIAGLYEVKHPDRPIGRTRLLCVNPVPGQSDLSPADQAALFTLFGNERVERMPFDELIHSYTRRHEISSWLLVLVLAALVAETLAGAWFTHRKERDEA